MPTTLLRDARRSSGGATDSRVAPGPGRIVHLLPVDHLDFASPVPLYFQLEAALRKAILSGELPVGVFLEPEMHIARRLNVSRPTIQHAFRRLASVGLVRRRRGDGTVVTGNACVNA